MRLRPVKIIGQAGLMEMESRCGSGESMRIKAKRFNQDIVIIDFVSVYDKAIKVKDSNINACFLDSNDGQGVFTGRRE